MVKKTRLRQSGENKRPGEKSRPVVDGSEGGIRRGIKKRQLCNARTFDWSRDAELRGGVLHFSRKLDRHESAKDWPRRVNCCGDWTNCRTGFAGGFTTGRRIAII